MGIGSNLKKRERAAEIPIWVHSTLHGWQCPTIGGWVRHHRLHRTQAVPNFHEVRLLYGSQEIKDGIPITLELQAVVTVSPADIVAKIMHTRGIWFARSAKASIVVVSVVRELPPSILRHARIQTEAYPP